MKDAATGDGDTIARSRRVTAAIAGLGIVGLAAALVLVFANVQVAGDLGTSRSCGSTFDSAFDRSGWELWWTHDLDEPDAAVRSQLLRTTQCPDAVNRRLAVSGSVGALGAVMVVTAVARRGRRTGVPTATTDSRIARLGRVTTTVGAALSAAGVLAVVALVADADSTLFLYVDRTVVALIGFIVLVPTLALIAIGRALTLVAPHLNAVDEQHAEPSQDATEP